MREANSAGFQILGPWAHLPSSRSFPVEAACKTYRHLNTFLEKPLGVTGCT